MAGRKAKSWALSRVGEGAFRWYRVFFNLFSVLSLAPVVWLAWRLPDEPVYSASAGLRWFMVAIQTLCLAAMALVVRQTGMAHFLGLAQLTGRGRQRSVGVLNVRGLYRYVRHPLYLLGLGLIWLSPVMSRNALALGAAMSAYFWIGSIHEERQLVGEFGDRYLSYRRVVPRIIPRPGRAYAADADEG
jgi:protein-S-isoprenylcysteine O-methyltransferase Ste14